MFTATAQECLRAASKQFNSFPMLAWEGAIKQLLHVWKTLWWWQTYYRSLQLKVKRLCGLNMLTACGHTLTSTAKQNK